MQLVRERLDGDFTTQLRVTRTPHFSHPSFAEEAEDFVVAELGAGFHWMNQITGWESGSIKTAHLRFGHYTSEWNY